MLRLHSAPGHWQLESSASPAHNTPKHTVRLHASSTSSFPHPLTFEIEDEPETMAITNKPARIALSLLYRQLWHAAKVDDFECFRQLYVYNLDMQSPAIHLYAGDADANYDVCFHHS